MIEIIDQYISSKEYTAKYLIGKNGSGKSYILKKISEQLEYEKVFINEEGEYITRIQGNTVQVDLINELYFFKMNESDRGNREKSDDAKILRIDKRLIELLKFLIAEKNKLSKIQNKSKGQNKLLNILNILTSVCLNPIKIILIDEPENFLDEGNLFILSQIFAAIEKAEIKLIVATHSSQLCRINKVKIDNIVLLNIKLQNGLINYNFYNEKNTELKGLYKKVSSDIHNYVAGKYDDDGGIKLKLNYYNDSEILDLYLNRVLMSEDFYRMLFYDEIFLLEGDTEKIIIKRLDLSNLRKTGFFSCNGKAFIPFWKEVFLKLGKNVTVMIDADYKENKLSAGITDFLLERDRDNVKVFNDYLEDFFGINVEMFRQKHNMVLKRNEHINKVYAADTFFMEEQNLKKFIKFMGW